MGNDLFEKAPIPKAYFSFALPVVFSMVISLVYNMADTYFIAATGNTNLVAGVSLGAPANLLTLASRMGYRTEFIGKVGTDMHGNFLKKTLEEEGIGTKYLI